MDVLRSINDHQQITTVLITHDPKVAAYARKIFHLEGGRLQEVSR
jgi:ABC-type lipoprotein export system ATPase subunit